VGLHDQGQQSPPKYDEQTEGQDPESGTWPDFTVSPNSPSGFPSGLLPVSPGNRFAFGVQPAFAFGVQPGQVQNTFFLPGLLPVTPSGNSGFLSGLRVSDNSFHSAFPLVSPPPNN
jgi:hypothetical protein